jgi:ketosteroid isomerase-like protein
MKRSLLFGSMFLLCLNVFSQGTSVKESRNDVADLTRINEQFIRNYLNNDTVAHNKIIHPDKFLIVKSDGSLMNRRDYMLEWSKGYNKETIPEFQMLEPIVRVFGDMAVITAKTRFKYQKDGKWTIGESRYSDTYIRENGQWKCVHVQLTKMPN